VHLGNYIAPSTKKPKEIDNTRGLNVTSLTDRFDTTAYLTPHSDLIALMVLEHQIDAINYMTRARFEFQLAEAGKGSEQRKTEAIGLLVRHLLFCGEVKLSNPLRGTSEFVSQFERRGPFDKHGRSLRQFDLNARLFRYPFSYMVYSKAFATLPTDIKRSVFRQVREVLTAEKAGDEFSHLSLSDKQAIREILQDTLPGFEELWNLAKAQ
jgi:hypothetical protein